MPSSLQNIEPPNSFNQFGLSAPLLSALGDAGYETPSPLQKACLPPLLAGRSLVVRGHSGTGKTLAFALPLLEGLDLTSRFPQILVLTQSDDISARIAELFIHLAKYLPGFHVLPIQGGEDQIVQLRQLERGAHVVIGTPRWVAGHAESQRLILSELRTLVLDDADELLNMGYKEDIEALMAQASGRLQMAVFAGGSPRRITRFLDAHLHDAVSVILPEQHVSVPQLRQHYWLVNANHKLEALIRFIEIEVNFNSALVFVHTHPGAVELADKLTARGYGANAVHGGTPVRQSALVAERLAKNQIDIVVATDNGLQDMDLARISHVIHYDLPCDIVAYRERICHAPAACNVLLLVIQVEMHMLHTIERGIGQSIEPLVLPERPRGY